MEDSCDQNPEFAVICSFIIQFGDKIDLELDIERLKFAIEDQSSLDEDLVNIHVKLIKKLRRYFVRDQWEKALIRFASEYSYEHAHEIEFFGYQKTRPSVKLELLRRLLDVQFQCDQKFKTAVNLCESNELRIPPLGRDYKGNTYWKKDDKEGHFRVYREEPLFYKSWKNICSNATELQDLIDELDKSQNEIIKGEPMAGPYNPLPEIFPEYFEVQEVPEQQSIEDKTVSSSKRSRSKGTRKTASDGLPIVEEENSILGSESNSVKIPPVEDSQSLDIKHKVEREKYSQENTADVPEEAISISTESQVKSTIENIINRVVASIEYIMRPLSRNSNDSQTNAETPPKPSQKRPNLKKKQEKVREEAVPRRASSRIQQLQLKKQAEQEEEMKKMIEREERKADQQETISQDEDSRSRTSNRNGTKKSERTSDGKKRKKTDWRKGRGKKKLSWDKDDSDLSSVSSPSESDDDDDFDDANDYTIDTNNLDDEFACEDEDTNIEPVIIRRARTARHSIMTSEIGDLNETTLLEEDKPCGRCDKSNDPEWILLCDMCDGGYHTLCTLPPLMIIPDGDWYCPSCEHKMLLTKLKEFYQLTSQIITVKKEAKKKRQPASKRKPAVKAEPAPIVLEPTYERYSDSEEFESSDEIAQLPSEDELPKTRRARASVSYKFKEYDALIKSAIRGESEGEPSSEEEDEPATQNYGRGKDMATIEALAYQQENGLAQEPVTQANKPSGARRKGRRLNDLDALSEAEDVTSDESFQASATEAEDAELTEEAVSDDTETSIDEIVGSLKKKRRKQNVRRNSYESDDSEYQPNRTRRRAATKRFSYAESSADEEEGSDFGKRTKKSKKTILSSDEETEASWKSESTKSDEDDDEDQLTPYEDDVTDEGEEPPAQEEAGQEATPEAHTPAMGVNPSLEESIDEIAAPLCQPKHQHIASATMTTDPMNQLNQYCLGQKSGSTMYNSFTQILSKDSPPHPPFYGDDDA